MSLCFHERHYLATAALAGDWQELYLFWPNLKSTSVPNQGPGLAAGPLRGHRLVRIKPDLIECYRAFGSSCTQGTTTSATPSLAFIAASQPESSSRKGLPPFTPHSFRCSKVSPTVLNLNTLVSRIVVFETTRGGHEGLLEAVLPFGAHTSGASRGFFALSSSCRSHSGGHFRS